MSDVGRQKAGGDERRRRTWSADQKQRIIAESFAPDASVAEVARRNCAQAWLASVIVNCFAYRNGAAIDALERAVRLSPLDLLGHLIKFAFALAHFQSKRYEEAVEWSDRALIQKPGFLVAMCIEAAAYGHLDRREGREWIERIGEISPDLTVESYRDFLSGFFVPEAAALQADGLRKAGMPAG